MVTGDAEQGAQLESSLEGGARKRFRAEARGGSPEGGNGKCGWKPANLLGPSTPPLLGSEGQEQTLGFFELTLEFLSAFPNNH